MTLRDVLAELDVQVRGAGAVRSANAELDQYARAATGTQSVVERLKLRQMEASEMASRLAGQVRILQRAEGDNAAAIEQTRLAMLRATQAAAQYGQAIAAHTRQASGGPYQGTSGGIGGQFFGGNAVPPPVAPALLTRAMTSWTEMSGAINVVGTGLHIVEGAAHAVANQIREVVVEGDELGDTAARLNLSVHALQEWRFIADSTGTDASAIARAFPILGRNIASTATAMRAEFRQLGVATRDSSGALRSQEDVFADTVIAIGRLPNATAQSAAAMRVFGRAGTELLPLIRSAPGDIDRLRTRFRELGGGLSDDVAVNAGKADQAMREFDLATDGARATLIGEFLPGLSSGIQTLAGFIGKMRQAWDTSYAGEVAFDILRGVAIGLGLSLLLVLSPIIALGVAAAATFLVVEDLMGAFSGGRSVIAAFWHNYEADALGAAASALSAVRSVQSALGLTDAMHATDALYANIQGRAIAARGVATADMVGLTQSTPQSARTTAEATAPTREQGSLPHASSRSRDVAAGATIDQSTTINTTSAIDTDALFRLIEQHNGRRMRETADTLARLPDAEPG